MAFIFGIVSIILGILQLIRPARHYSENIDRQPAFGNRETDLFNLALSVVLIAFGLFLLYASLRGLH